jgi:hypothetical protein
VAAGSRPITRLRKLCLALPESHEVEAWGEPTFRVKNRIFAMFASANTHHGAGRPSVWVKSAHVTQDMLVRAEPARYFVPPYVGPKGWIGVYLDDGPDWDALADLLADAHRGLLPARLRAKLGLA